VVAYDSNDKMIRNFLFSAANIFAFIYGQKEMTEEEVMAISDKLNVPKFVPKKQAIKENENDETVEGTEDDEQIIKDALTYLKSVTITEGMAVNVVDFEKDDDSNHHIDFLTAVSNLRARNYKITEGSRHKVKMIAGKIIPAIATSTALIVGMCGMELIKSIVHPDKVEITRNAYVNLATPLWLFSEPMPPMYQTDKEYDPIMMGPVKVVPGKFSCWDKTQIQGPLTL
jgi:ubiquitin-activating enzyme E1